MDESKANALAQLLGGSVWDSGGGINLVVVERGDGVRVVISDEAICEYRNDEAMESGEPLTTIRLA